MNDSPHTTIKLQHKDPIPIDLLLLADETKEAILPQVGVVTDLCSSPKQADLV